MTEIDKKEALVAFLNRQMCEKEKENSAINMERSVRCKKIVLIIFEAFLGK